MPNVNPNVSRRNMLRSLQAMMNALSGIGDSLEEISNDPGELLSDLTSHGILREIKAVLSFYEDFGQSLKDAVGVGGRYSPEDIAMTNHIRLLAKALYSNLEAFDPEQFNAAVGQDRAIRYPVKREFDRVINLDPPFSEFSLNNQMTETYIDYTTWQSSYNRLRFLLESFYLFLENIYKSDIFDAMNSRYDPR